MSDSDPPSFDCPICGRRSYHPEDLKNRYCTNCGFVDDVIASVADDVIASVATPPGYWMNETSGVLRPAVEAFLQNRDMTPDQIAAMRAYLRQWIMHPSWRGVEDLRAGIDLLTTKDAIMAWVASAVARGADPL